MRVAWRRREEQGGRTEARGGIERKRFCDPLAWLNSWTMSAPGGWTSQVGGGGCELPA